MRFTIDGPPRTKSNHQSIMRGKRGRPFVMQSPQYRDWEAKAIDQLKAQARGKTFTDPEPVNLTAHFYRERNTGDLGNYLKALCDALQRAEIVVNDKWIRGFDGSRLHVDKGRPRVELWLYPLEQEAKRT